jgi:hypothetical protein
MIPNGTPLEHLEHLEQFSRSPSTRARTSTYAEKVFRSVPTGQGVPNRERLSTTPRPRDASRPAQGSGVTGRTSSKPARVARSENQLIPNENRNQQWRT